LRIDTRDLTLAAVFTSLYVVTNFVQAATVGNPAISGPVQLRVADCLIPLAALFGMPVVAGVTVGGVLTNAYVAYVAPVDVILGPIANLVAATLAMSLRKHHLLAAIVAAFPIGIIVGGGYLWWFFPLSDILGLALPLWLATMISLIISSLIATALLGYALLRILASPEIVDSLQSRGLKVDV
jgi:hypothetical protein